MRNKSIMEVVKYMIHDQDIPMHLWDEGARTKVYIHNRISHNDLGNKNPKEMFTKENIEVNHLKIISMPCIYTCSQGENIKVGSFRK